MVATSAQPRVTAGWVDVLADVPLFEGLSKRQLRKVAQCAIARRYPRFTAVVREGARGDSFFVILDGTATVKRPGKRHIKLKAGDFFGDMALIDGAVRTATVETDSDVLTIQIGRTQFGKLLEDEPRIALVLLRTLAGRLRAAESTAVS
jgi:CRP/FNR family transcriptional regulator, cyclic AMP receptor protein